MAELKPAAAALTPRELIWAALRANRDGVTQRRINGLTLVKPGIIRDYVASLMRAGIVGVVAELGPGQPREYCLLRDMGVDAPRLKKDGTLLPPSADTGDVYGTGACSCRKPSGGTHRGQ